MPEVFGAHEETVLSAGEAGEIGRIDFAAAVLAAAVVGDGLQWSDWVGGVLYTSIEAAVVIRVVNIVVVIVIIVEFRSTIIG